MLNTSTSSMAYHTYDNPYMTPTRTGHQYRSPDDYFASSLDFEYDLFLKGLVSCDRESRARSSVTRRDLFSSSSWIEPSGYYQDSGRVPPVPPKRNPLNASLFSLQCPLSRSGTTPGSPIGTSASFRHLTKSRQHATSNDYITFRPSSAASQQSSQQQQSSLARSPPKPSKLRGDTSPVSPLPAPSNWSAASQGTHPKPPSPTPTPPPASSQSLSSAAIVPTPTLAETVDFEPGAESIEHQHLHALHRFRAQRKKGLISRLRDVVISFTPKARLPVVNRPELYIRFGKEEQDTLAAFDFLDSFHHDDDENNNKEQGSREEKVEEEPNEPRIDLVTEEYDLLNPVKVICDTSLSDNEMDNELGDAFGRSKQNQANIILESKLPARLVLPRKSNSFELHRVVEENEDDDDESSRATCSVQESSSSKSHRKGCRPFHRNKKTKKKSKKGANNN